MPWWTLDYEQREKKEELSDKFGISGIPTLILLDADSGNIVCKDARDQIQNQDKEGKNFPWNSKKKTKSKDCILI
jgi:nucleoredoxin